MGGDPQTGGVRAEPPLSWSTVAGGPQFKVLEAASGPCVTITPSGLCVGYTTEDAGEGSDDGPWSTAPQQPS